MADKKKGNSKKIFIIGAAVVAFIVVLVLILTNCLPRGKSTEELYNDVASYRLMETDYHDQSTQFINKVGENANTSYYKTELSDINKMITSMETVSEYYDDYFVVAQGGMKGKNAGSIHGRLESIKQYKNELTSILKESQSISATGNTYLQNAVVDFRNTFVKLVEDYKHLFTLSNQVYHDSLGACLVVNPASRVTLNIVDDFMAVISKEYNALTQIDVAGSKQESYSFASLDAKINAFAKFVETNFGLAGVVNAENIVSYYPENLNVFDTLAAYPSALGETNYQNVIATISYDETTLVCNYTISEGVNANSETLAILKNILLGGAI